ncbi:Myb-like DNA-binding domain containing protein [Tritrichomonas foetus]|uniref:Myb-like DNA-binding domain containing protein n=1 Tax=Tritrichomonas foetus TaxID=1144522 RepID=A0A1J4J964_9EUKA|nr:Myb-like DNA-binding domain containing protein [Tritrichomonas foetus]|eukprot:OHS94791.1 Myb-like DNA-binding domain containing protein [Tritrichomonas foetus]
MHGRNSRQCRERWKHYLSSSRVKLPWTPEEDQLLYNKMEELGPKWTKISAFFFDRTDIQVKSRWMQRFADVSKLHLKNRDINKLLNPHIYQNNQPISNRNNINEKVNQEDVSSQHDLLSTKISDNSGGTISNSNKNYNISIRTISSKQNTGISNPQFSLYQNQESIFGSQSFGELFSGSF